MYHIPTQEQCRSPLRRVACRDSPLMHHLQCSIHFRDLRYFIPYRGRRDRYTSWEHSMRISRSQAITHRNRSMIRGGIIVRYKLTNILSRSSTVSFPSPILSSKGLASISIGGNPIYTTNFWCLDRICPSGMLGWLKMARYHLVILHAFQSLVRDLASAVRDHFTVELREYQLALSPLRISTYL
jgi:hypothetical protein